MDSKKLHTANNLLEPLQCFIINNAYLCILIIEPTLDMTSQNKDLQTLIIEGIHERKGRGVTVVDMSAIEDAPVSKFIIAQGTSAMQVAAIADSVREYVQKEGGVKPYNYDGYTNSEWIVIDYGDVLAHIFVREARERYRLEELWSDAVITDVPDLD